MRWKTVLSLVKVILSGLGLALISFALTQSWDGLAPLGSTVVPSGSLWRHKPTDREILRSALAAALQDAKLAAVTLTIGDDDIPHIEAADDESLYFAQGFVTAFYRLWQMDFVTRVVSGRIAELVGPKALPIDRFFRRLDVVPTIRGSVDMMLGDPYTRGPLTAYTSGVQAWQKRVTIERLPLEYRLFGTKPELWTADRTASLLKFMTWQLSGYLDDILMTETKNRLAPELFNTLFPPYLESPGTILPNRATRVGGSSSPRPFQATAGKGQPVLSAEALRELHQALAPIAPAEGNGSNNWAMPGHRSNKGRPILANDTHLTYSLPAIWFSIQLTTPKMNVYGASIPGAPGVIVGFNETMGWAVTNGSDDVLDWYSFRFRDEKHQEYLFEESWRPVITREEDILVAGAPSEKVKIRETHIGPIVFDTTDAPGVMKIPQGLAMQWVGHLPSNELKSFLMLNRSTRAEDCFAALQNYTAASQNFLCADRNGRIVFKHAGLFPDRNGMDGRAIREASTAKDLWQGMLPADESPMASSVTDIIVTANQAPFASAESAKFGWFFAPPYRALQIRENLEAKKTWEPEDVVGLQFDTKSWIQRAFVKIVLREAEQPTLAGELKNNTKCEFAGDDFLRRLREWDGSFPADSRLGPVVDRWINTLEKQTWTRVIGPYDQVLWPGHWRFYQLMEAEPTSPLWNDALAGSEPRTLNHQLAVSLTKACEELHAEHGRGVLWGHVQPTTIDHVAHLPGLGKVFESIGGKGSSTFANKGNHGPTWNMVVSFEDWPRAWATIPGGQSGDPASLHYDNLIEDWSKGKLPEVRFLRRTNQGTKQ